MGQERLHPQHALAVVAESLAAGGRVAVFGDASVDLAGVLLEQGARTVTVWDPDEERARIASEGAPRGVSVRPYAPGDPGPRGPDPRTVDLAIVSDLGLFDDPSDLVSRVRRLVGEHGVALIAAANREAGTNASEGFDYYELFDLIAREFDGVRMVAQLPFYGVALMELGGDDEPPAVNVDTRLADAGRAPDAFVVVASHRPDRALDPYSIVELPGPPVLEAALEAVTTSGAVEDSVTLAALAEAQLRANVLESQLLEVRSRAAEGARAVEAISALESDLAARSRRVAELEAALAGHGRTLGELSSEVEKVRAAGRSADDALRGAAAKSDEVARRADHAERRVLALENEIGHAVEAQAGELVRLEEALRERSQAVRLLEGEVALRDRMVRDLVGVMDEAPPASPVEAGARGDAGAHDALADANAHLRGRLDALALDLARREGAAQASAWRIEELERQLAQASAAHPASPVAANPATAKSGPALSAALDELDTLRKAFVQEHEARVRAESGEELARARVEIERQAVLLNQLTNRSEEDSR